MYRLKRNACFLVAVAAAWLFAPVDAVNQPPQQHPALLEKRSPQDITTRLSMLPKMKVIFSIRDGLDTRWEKIGSYDFVTEVEFANATGYSYKWRMTEPALASGIRATEADDVMHSHRVSLFYPQQQTCTMVGYTNILRISDDLYNSLKQGSLTAFELDGPDTPMKFNREVYPLPHQLQMVGEDLVDIYVNDRLVQVKAIRAETDNGWRYWVMDNPRFPILVRGEGPFFWENVQLKHPAFEKLFDDGAGDGNSSAETRRIISDLEDKGEATTRAILFDFDKYNIKPVSRPILDGLAAYLRKRDVSLIVEGHTDIIGGMDYNMKLSMRRANSVKQYLVKYGGIKRERLFPKGFGYTRPVATNATAAGRQLNRRVVFKRIGK